MIRIKTIAAALLLAIPLAACVEGGGPSPSGGGDSLAVRANLSPEAIRLQSQTQRLLTLEEEQTAAARRVQSFTAQGALLGGGGGAVAGLLLCNIRNCTDEQRRNAVIGGAVAGGVAGGVAGNQQARRQNVAAQTENAIRRRIQIAGQQLSTAREARRQAQAVARLHQQRLNTLKRQVAAGQADRSQLNAARADARRDAKEVRSTRNAMRGSSRSLNQGEKGNASIARNKSALDRELAAVNQAEDALLASIANSSL